LIVLPPLSFSQNELLPSTTLLAGDHTATSPKMKASQLLIPGQTSSSRSHATPQDLHTNLDDSSTELLQSVSHADFKPPTNNRISPSSLQYQQHLVVPPHHQKQYQIGHTMHSSKPKLCKRIERREKHNRCRTPKTMNNQVDSTETGHTDITLYFVLASSHSHITTTA
jgi:hypothetical protein